MCSDRSMSNLKILVATGGALMMGAALAQIQATSASTYFLDVDPARYAGPASKRVAMLLDDEPRQVQLSPQDEICLQLQRADNGDVISARVRVLRPEPQALAVVRVAGPNISPGTYRSTPSGMLLRVSPAKVDGGKPVETVASNAAPVCEL